MQRKNQRAANQLRHLTITRHYTKHAEGSVFIELGETKVLCNTSVTDGVPRWKKGEGSGWLTAEYGMLPRSTGERMRREAIHGKQGGRTLEIQRLIGRALRASVDLDKLGENTIYVDCDVIQADGGTRTAAITGACVALVDALRFMQREKLIDADPLIGMVAAISVGMLDGTPALDLDYSEDSSADTDMNIVMNTQGQFIEIQGTAEQQAFTEEELRALLDLAHFGIVQLIQAQQAALQAP